MSPISPTETTFVPRREFIRDQRPASAFSILALSGAALVRLYSFPTDTILALRRHLESIHVILSSRELPHDNFHELALDGKPWSSPKSMRSEKLLIDIIDVIHLTGHNFLTTMDYGREQDDRIVMAFSRTFPSPLSNAVPPPFHSMSNDSLSVVPHPIKLLFAISFISQSHLRVIAPPLHLTPAILQTVRGSWPRGVVSEKKVAENVYEFKLKGYKWFQEDTFATDSLRHILSLLGTLDGFGFTLLTSLSLNNRSRSKDLWVFTGVSQTNPPESQAGSSHGSRSDLHATSFEKARDRRRSYQGPAHSATANNWPSHTRAATEHSLAHLSHNPPPSSSSSMSAIVRKPAPRAQLPVSVAQSTASNDNVHDGGVPSSHAVPSEELRVELQSDVGSAVDMTGVGTQKYGRAGEPEKSLYQQASRFHSMTPGAPNPYYPNMSTSVVNTMQPSGSPQGVQTAGRTGTSAPKRSATTSSIPLRSRASAKATSQPVTPLLSPGAFRDSALSSNTGQTAELSSTWPGAGRGNGLSSIGIHGDDHVLPGGWIPTSVEGKEIRTLGDHPNESNVHDHALRSQPNLEPEEQEVKVSIPELVRPRRRLARSGEATLVHEAHRADIHRMNDADRHHPSIPSMRSAPDRRETDPPKSPDGWVLVSVGQPSMTGAPQAPKPTSRPNLRRKQSFPPTKLQKPQHSASPHSTGFPGATTGPPDGRGHKKAASNPNPSSMSPAAKAIVILDAMQAKRKATSGDAPQSSFRKFFSLSRPESPKSPSKEGRPALSGGGAKGKIVERGDSVRRREGTRRMRGTPEARSGGPDPD